MAAPTRPHARCVWDARHPSRAAASACGSSGHGKRRNSSDWNLAGPPRCAPRSPRRAASLYHRATARRRRSPEFEEVPMCGIVAAVAQRDVVPLLIAGLKALEYRGYDSAGISVLENGRLARVRAKGKVRELEALYESSPVA